MLLTNFIKQSKNKGHYSQVVIDLCFAICEGTLTSGNDCNDNHVYRFAFFKPCLDLKKLAPASSCLGDASRPSISVDRVLAGELQ